ncbi:MAG: TlpA family protein disulfide reductase, partial [Hyphomicrobiaceae bacterium]
MKPVRKSRPQVPSGPSRVALVVTAAAAALAGFGAVYVMAGGTDNGPPAVRTAQAVPASPQRLPAGPGSNPLSVGQMAAFVFKKAPEELPELPFLDKDGKSRLLKEWNGKVVLLNLWA